MKRTGLLALTLSCVACAAGPEEGVDLRPVRFAVLPAPGLGADQAAEDALLEAVTLLSLDPQLDLILVPGPLLAPEPDDPAWAQESLVGALGSLAASCYPGWGPQDGPEDELSEALDRGLADHKGRVGYAGKPVRGLLPVVLTPEGALPEGSAGPGLLVAGGALPEATAGWLVVRAEAGAAPRLEPRSGGGLELVLPPLGEPPHLFAVASWDGAQLVVELRRALEPDVVEALGPAPFAQREP